MCNKVRLTPLIFSCLVSLIFSAVAMAETLLILYLLTCSTCNVIYMVDSYVRIFSLWIHSICRSQLVNPRTLVLLDSFVKIWATFEHVLGKRFTTLPPPLPPGKNCLYVLASPLVCPYLQALPKLTNY